MAGWDYALVHLMYTIPPAIFLTVVFRPFQTRLDIYKIGILLIIAVASTIPWDSYLLHRGVWTYPASSILGPTLFLIPIEELFFFVIQTYITSILYLLLAKPVLGASYLPIQPQLARGQRQSHNHTADFDAPLRPNGTGEYERLERCGAIGTALLVALIGTGGYLVLKGGAGLYIGLILIWAGPFILFLWCLSFQFIAAVPLSISILPIIVPTLYLWLVDSLALSKGTWVITSDTKCGIKLFGVLELEEAIFFVATNVLVVFGQLAFDHALSVIYAFPTVFPTAVQSTPSVGLLLKALLLPSHKYENRVAGIRDALRRLNAKSRSFSLASSVFEGRLRIDLVLLYSFCRTADDLVDEAPTSQDAQLALDSLSEALEGAYLTANRTPSIMKKGLGNSAHATISNQKEGGNGNAVTSKMSNEVLSSINILPLNVLPLKPLQDLLQGFRIDLKFPSRLDANTMLTLPSSAFPIRTEEDLNHYAYCVAGTVASLLLHLVFEQSYTSVPNRYSILEAGINMGKALQYINIARDIQKDAEIGRCYLPSSWLAEYHLTPLDVLHKPNTELLHPLRKRLLNRAMTLYKDNVNVIDQVPEDCGSRRGVRAAVENYVEIGRVLIENFDVKRKISDAGGGREKATVGKMRRIWVFVNALRQG